MHSRIDGAELPVTHVTRRQGRPYTLVLTKTDALFTADLQSAASAAADLEWLAATWPILAETSGRLECQTLLSSHERNALSEVRRTAIRARASGAGVRLAGHRCQRRLAWLGDLGTEMAGEPRPRPGLTARPVGPRRSGGGCGTTAGLGHSGAVRRRHDRGSGVADATPCRMTPCPGSSRRLTAGSAARPRTGSSDGARRCAVPAPRLASYDHPSSPSARRRRTSLQAAARTAGGLPLTGTSSETSTTSTWHVPARANPDSSGPTRLEVSATVRSPSRTTRLPARLADVNAVIRVGGVADDSVRLSSSKASMARHANATRPLQVASRRRRGQLRCAATRPAACCARWPGRRTEAVGPRSRCLSDVLAGPQDAGADIADREDAAA